MNNVTVHVQDANGGIVEAPGIKACLQGLAEQGCNGTVHDALDKLERHLNKAAHGQEE